MNRDILINDINRNRNMIDIAEKSESQMRKESLKRNAKSNTRSLFTLGNGSINSSNCRRYINFCFDVRIEIFIYLYISFKCLDSTCENNLF